MSKYIPEELRKAGEGEAVRVDLNRPMKEILAQLSQYPVSTRLSLNGTIVVGRDIAHAETERAHGQRRRATADHQRSPDLLREAGKNAGRLCLRFSWFRTTAGRMDSYVDQLQAQGG